jgi:hypothetical protein
LARDFFDTPSMPDGTANRIQGMHPETSSQSADLTT